MENITYTFEKKQVWVDNSRPEYPNVISKVLWALKFTNGIESSSAMIETYFDTSTLINFITIDNVTDDILEQWVIEKEGGDAFINGLKSIHVNYINKMAIDSKLEAYYIDSSMSQNNGMPGYQNFGNAITNSTNEIFEAPIL